VAEVFTNRPGKYVPLKETIRGFAEILDGKHDDLPEQAFYMVGTIDEAVEAAKGSGEKEPEAKAEAKTDAPAHGKPEEKTQSKPAAGGKGDEKRPQDQKAERPKA
jgi:hypothetical protein